jgi:hypothetical protein
MKPPLWSSGQSSWLQIQRSRFDSQHYQILWEVVGLEWGPFSLVSTTEELLGRESSGSGLEIREYSRRNLSCWPRGANKRRSLGWYSSLADSNHKLLYHSEVSSTLAYYVILFYLIAQRLSILTGFVLIVTCKYFTYHSVILCYIIQTV